MTLRELRSTWENLGRTDPLWAVLTDPSRRDGKWTVDEFLATGRQPVQMINRLLGKHDRTLGARVLDFGCGVGRLSNALAEHAESVVGIDIAASMIDNANEINRLPDRLSFVHYDGGRLPFEDASFDSVVSLISLQHSRPPVQLAALLEFQRVVRPGGVLVFQLPSQPRIPDPLPAEAMRANIELLSAPATVPAGHLAQLSLRVTNVSPHRWPVGRLIRVGDHWLDLAGEPAVQDDGRVDLPYEILPGEAFDTSLPIIAPSTPGRYRVIVDLVQEAVTWWAKAGNSTAEATVEVTEAAAIRAAHVDEAQVTEDVGADEPDPVIFADKIDPKMEMHGLSCELVRSLFNYCGCVVRAVTADTMAGDEWESFTYVVERET
ncbi:MAG TPA: methyltransferase domain-containing protein [Pseudonocardiaceae bacterium]|jgi:SAM-dependent methyltransferase|nr:methyltransferase domain-containing protein [Pseudonocardiaceae bacterium]